MKDNANSDRYPPDSSDKEDFHLLLKATVNSNPSSMSLSSILAILAWAPGSKLLNN